MPLRPLSQQSKTPFPVSTHWKRGNSWRRNFEGVLKDGTDLEARAAMQLGAHFAGVAIENSMLGATHACANPLTARFGTTHGLAIALLLPSVVRWNGSVVGDQYSELLRASTLNSDDGNETEGLASHLESLARIAGFPHRLRELGIAQAELQSLAELATQQWTGQFNPRLFNAAGALEIYQGSLLMRATKGLYLGQRSTQTENSG